METYETNNSVGQIIYNLKDYRKQKYLSTNKKGGGEIIESDSLDIPAESDNRFNIYTDIFNKTFLENKEIHKIGIQAPPGTKFKINNDKEIVMGRTGIYELDERFPITNLQFYKIPIYRKDENQTDRALREGMNRLQLAVDEFNSKVSQLGDISSPNYWKNYNNLYKEYVERYEVAYSLFIRGVNGIYIKEDKEKEVENVIIDFLYGQRGQE